MLRAAHSAPTQFIAELKRSAKKENFRLPKNLQKLNSPVMSLPTMQSLLSLPKKRRLAIAESLWLSVADESSLPVPLTHKKLLDKRLSDYHSGKSKPITHDELMNRLRSA